MTWAFYLLPRTLSAAAPRMSTRGRRGCAIHVDMMGDPLIQQVLEET